MLLVSNITIEWVRTYLFVHSEIVSSIANTNNYIQYNHMFAHTEMVTSIALYHWWFFININQLFAHRLDVFKYCYLSSVDVQPPP